MYPPLDCKELAPFYPHTLGARELIPDTSYEFILPKSRVATLESIE